jgi:type I restriction enzyme S subunit
LTAAWLCSVVPSNHSTQGFIMMWEWNGNRFDECVVFFKVNEKWGGLSNMSNDFPLRIGEIEVKSSEALYQALRFPHQPDWQREILDAPHAMQAKMKAKKGGRKRDHSRPDWDQKQVEVMEWCLQIKLAQHFQDSFLRLLRWTAPHAIVELSNNDRFWGAVQDQDGVLRGENMLGRLLVKLRDEAITLVSQGEEHRLLRLQPPAITEFRLLGREIGVIEAQPQLAAKT